MSLGEEVLLYGFIRNTRTQPFKEIRKAMLLSQYYHDVLSLTDIDDNLMKFATKALLDKTNHYRRNLDEQVPVWYAIGVEDNETISELSKTSRDHKCLGVVTRGLWSRLRDGSKKYVAQQHKGVAKTVLLIEIDDNPNLIFQPYIIDVENYMGEKIF